MCPVGEVREEREGVEDDAARKMCVALQREGYIWLRVMGRRMLTRDKRQAGHR